MPDPESLPVQEIAYWIAREIPRMSLSVSVDDQIVAQKKYEQALGEIIKDWNNDEIKKLAFSVAISEFHGEDLFETFTKIVASSK